MAVSFQWWWAYSPAPNMAAVIAADNRNGKYGSPSRLRHSDNTSATEHPTINSPPTSAPA